MAAPGARSTAPWWGWWFSPAVRTGPVLLVLQPVKVAVVTERVPVVPVAGSVAAGDVPALPLDAAVLGDLASIVLESTPLELVLQRLALIAERAIPGAAAVSVTVVRDRAAISAGFTGAIAAALDERQYASGFGPCLHAAATAGEVVVADTAAEVVYPAFAAVAARHGIGSAVALGLAVAGSASAALNVYRAGPPGATAMVVTTRAARVFAAYASVAVSNAAALDADRATSAGLAATMAARAGVEQAKGVLMAQRAITAQAAFALLAAASLEGGITLAAMAEQVLSTAGGDGRLHA